LESMSYLAGVLLQALAHERQESPQASARYVGLLLGGEDGEPTGVREPRRHPPGPGSTSRALAGEG
jgi:hypothetical protein